MEVTPKQRRVLQRFVDLPEADREEVLHSVQELFIGLRTEWETDPANKGKTITFTELFSRFIREQGLDNNQNS